MAVKSVVKRDARASRTELTTGAQICGDKLSQLQKQLHEGYRRDEFLRDQIFISADTSQIQQSMRERVPSADALNSIATFFSSESKSAGAFSALHDIDDAHYTAGYEFDGGARKSLRGP